MYSSSRLQRQRTMIQSSTLLELGLGLGLGLGSVSHGNNHRACTSQVMLAVDWTTKGS